MTSALTLEEIRLSVDVTHSKEEKIDTIEEPWIKATIIVPDEYLGAVLELCTSKRGIQINLNYAGTRAMVEYKLPLNEVVFDFYERYNVRFIRSNII